MNTPDIPRHANSIFKTKHEVPYDIDIVKIAAEKREFVDSLKQRHGSDFLKLEARIKNNSKRLFLFVGGDPKLMKELVGLHHCTTDATYLCYDNLLCKAEIVTTIEAKKKVDELFRGQVFQCELNPDTVYEIASKIIMPDKSKSYQFELATLECRLRQNCTIFFDCLGCRDTPFLQSLSKKISDIKSLYDSIPKGRLIISTLTSRADIPSYFQSSFEVIELEPEMQPTGQATPATKNTANRPQKQGIPVKKKQINKLFFTYNAQNRIVLSFKSKKESVLLTEKEGKLLLFLEKDRRTLEEIIEHIWGVKDVRKQKNNVLELRYRVNKKCAKMGVETLISKLNNRYYALTIDAVER